jgi:hypothetical protein
MTETREALYSGGCQCGARRYALFTAPYGAHLCHCRMCQKAVGGPFAALAVVKLADFAWTRGAPAIFKSSPRVGRGFCPDCGTPLTIQDLGAARIDFTIASLDSPAGVAPERQIGAESRLPWFEALAGLPEQRTEDTVPAEAPTPIENLQHPDRDTETWPPAR